MKTKRLIKLIIAFGIVLIIIVLLIVLQLLTNNFQLFELNMVLSFGDLMSIIIGIFNLIILIIFITKFNKIKKRSSYELINNNVTEQTQKDLNEKLKINVTKSVL